MSARGQKSISHWRILGWIGSDGLLHVGRSLLHVRLLNIRLGTIRLWSLLVRDGICGHRVVRGGPTHWVRSESCVIRYDKVRVIVGLEWGGDTSVAAGERSKITICGEGDLSTILNTAEVTLFVPSYLAGRTHVAHVAWELQHRALKLQVTALLNM